MRITPPGAVRAAAARMSFLIAAALVLHGCASRETDSPRVDREAAARPTAELRQCLTDLAATGAQFDRLPDRNYGGGCSIEGAVQLRAVRGDANLISLSNLGPLECEAALSFANWSRFGAGRAAQQVLQSPLERIETFGSYSCRNVAGSNRRSGHARARAIDVSAFRLGDGRRISVTDDWTKESANSEFLKIVHRSACRRFGTVLGPDYNTAHDDHFHFETDTAQFCR